MDFGMNAAQWWIKLNLTYLSAKAAPGIAGPHLFVTWQGTERPVDILTYKRGWRNPSLLGNG